MTPLADMFGEGPEAEARAGRYVKRDVRRQERLYRRHQRNVRRARITDWVRYRWTDFGLVILCSAVAALMVYALLYT